MAFNPTSRTVQTEGCHLHYWYQGSGPLLIMIPGGNGVGRQYNKIFEHLAGRFTVCTFDRRQHSDSTVEEKQLLNPIQQCRDVIAIIKDMGFKKTSIFGNSGGAVLAFQFAVSYPQWLDHVVAHEAPTMALLEDTTEYINWVFELIFIYRKQGALAAQAEFNTQMIGLENSPPLSPPSDEDRENFWANEFLQFSTYCPDLRQIVRNEVSIVVAAGIKSADACYVRTTFQQAEILGCPRLVVSGHHVGFQSEPAEFARELIEALDEMERKSPRWN